jgi:hypothetical protein
LMSPSTSLTESRKAKRVARKTRVKYCSLQGRAGSRTAATVGARAHAGRSKRGNGARLRRRHQQGWRQRGACTAPTAATRLNYLPEEQEDALRRRQDAAAQGGPAPPQRSVACLPMHNVDLRQVQQRARGWELT